MVLLWWFFSSHVASTMRKWQHGKATDPTPKDCLPADAPYPKLDMFIVQVLIEDHFHQGYRHAGVGHR